MGVATSAPDLVCDAIMISVSRPKSKNSLSSDVFWAYLVVDTGSGDTALDFLTRVFAVPVPDAHWPMRFVADEIAT